MEEGVVGVIGWENWEGREEEREREKGRENQGRIKLTNLGLESGV